LPWIRNEVESVLNRVQRLEHRIEHLQEALGRIENRQLASAGNRELIENEFRAFSQWGEDGIIQFLLRHVKIDRKVFVEFGADNYNAESNTRFLLANNNWSGLVMDSSREAIQQLKHTGAFVRYDLKAIPAFITTDNINSLLVENGITGDIGLLSIDVDGNDYWIWKAITVINPAIVIIEYNHRFGSELAVTIPYDESFDRTKAHPSRLYYGASLKALCKLGTEKGYAFVGCNSNGVNAFFVRTDKKPEAIATLTAEEGFVSGGFGEMFEQDGQLTRRSPFEESDFLMNLGLPLVEV